MKKVTTFAAIISLAISFASCTKSAADLANKYSEPYKPPVIAKEITVISNWVSPNSFSVTVDRLGGYSIIGSYPFTSSSQQSYDEGIHVEFVYGRIPGHGTPYTYKKLAFGFGFETNGVTSHILTDYLLDPNGLKILFKSGDYPALVEAVDQTISENWSYRYIIIPKTKYQTMNIDWNDLPAVATALNFPL